MSFFLLWWWNEPRTRHTRRSVALPEAASAGLLSQLEELKRILDEMEKGVAEKEAA